MGGAPSLAQLAGTFTQRVVVGVGDMAVSNNPAVTISTYALGSCVGVVALDASSNVGGMLHVMLPDSALTPDKARTQPSMFADAGMAVFMRELNRLGAVNSRIKVFLAGGANVLSGSDFFRIGERNIQAIRGIVRQLRLTVVAEELGGLNNRTLHFQIQTGVVDMKLPNTKKQVRLK